MKGLRLYKKEKLCSETAIDELFSRKNNVSGALEYPLRALWRENPARRSDSPIAFVISVPKKRLRHAVDRVAMRRRIREAYRLARHKFPIGDSRRIDLALIFVANRLALYSSVERAVEALLAKVSQPPGETSVTPADNEG